MTRMVWSTRRSSHQAGTVAAMPEVTACDNSAPIHQETRHRDAGSVPRDQPRRRSQDDVGNSARHSRHMAGPRRPLSRHVLTEQVRLASFAFAWLLYRWLRLHQQQVQRLARNRVEVGNQLDTRQQPYSCKQASDTRRMQVVCESHHECSSHATLPSASASGTMRYHPAPCLLPWRVSICKLSEASLQRIRDTLTRKL